VSKRSVDLIVKAVDEYTPFDPSINGALGDTFAVDVKAGTSVTLQMRLVESCQRDAGRNARFGTIPQSP